MLVFFLDSPLAFEGDGLQDRIFLDLEVIDRYWLKNDSNVGRNKKNIKAPASESVFEEIAIDQPPFGEVTSKCTGL